MSASPGPEGTDAQRGPLSPVNASLLVGGFAFAFYCALLLWILPPGQFSKYVTAARMLVNHELPAERLADFSLLYLYFHAGVQKFMAQPALAVYLVHALLAALSATLLFRLLASFYGPKISALGALAFVLSSNVMVSIQAFEPEAFVIFFLLGFLFSVSGIGPVWPLIAGIFFGLGLLTRPNFLPVLVVVPFYYFWHEQARWKKAAVSVLVFLLPVTGSLLFLGYNSRAILGYPMISMNPGTVFYEGNNPISCGQGAMYPPLVNEYALQFPGEPDYQHVAYRLFARGAVDPALTIPEVNAYWAGKGTNFLRDHPGLAVKRLFRKLFLSLHGFDWHDLVTTYWNQKKLRRGWMPGVPFGAISALALLGFIVCRRAWRRRLLIDAALLFQVLMMAVVYVSLRQRAGVTALFIIPACGGLAFIWENRKKIWPLLLPVPLALGLSIPTDLMKAEDDLWEKVDVSNANLGQAIRMRQAGLSREASRLSALSLAEAPWAGESRRPANLSFAPRGYVEAALESPARGGRSAPFDRAVLYFIGGRWEEAEVLFSEILEKGTRIKRDYYQSAEPNYYLGRIAVKRGNPELAMARLKKGLERTPGDPWILAEMAVVSGDERYRERLLRYFGDIDAQFLLGVSYLENGNAGSAVECLSFVASAIPDFRRVQIYLAVALGKAGRLTEAISLYLKQIRKTEDPVLLEDESLGLFKEYARTQAMDPEAFYNYGIVLRQFGHFEEALEIQRKILYEEPGSMKAQAEIQRLEMLIAGGAR